MLAKLFIKRIAKRHITIIVHKYVADEEMREKCIECLVQLVMDVSGAIGYKEFIKIIWRARSK